MSLSIQTCDAKYITHTPISISNHHIYTHKTHTHTHTKQGLALKKLATFYAHTIIDSQLQFDVLFGPAYKGITLASAVAVALAELTGRDVPFAYNRKEAKDHGEGGVLVGAEMKGRKVGGCVCMSV